MVRDSDNIVNLMRLRPQESELIGAVMKPFVAEISGWHRSRMCRSGNRKPNVSVLRQNIWLLTFF